MATIRSDFDDLERDMMRKALDPRKTKRLERQSIEWFQEKTGQRKKSKTRKEALEEGITFQDYVRGKQGIKNRFWPGQLFTYQYDAKTKATLPYWDKFPMVMPIHLYEDGWLAINLHYLPPYLRSRLLGVIRGTMRSKKLSREAKANLTYGMIKSASELAIAKPAVKRYLKDHVRSKIVRIHPQEWQNAIFLPTDAFQGASRQQVWRDSMRNMR